jgi:hypothetical protein
MLAVLLNRILLRGLVLASDQSEFFSASGDSCP